MQLHNSRFGFPLLHNPRPLEFFSGLFVACRVKLPQVVGIGRTDDSTFGDQPGDQFVRGHVECRVADFDPRGTGAPCTKIRDFFRIAFFDGDSAPSGMSKSIVE